MRSAVSQLLVQSPTINENNKKIGVLQRFRSLGEHLHITGTPNNIITISPSTKSHISPAILRIEHRTKTISSSTGYLNFKDVFFPGSITALPEYNQDQQRFRSITSLQQPDKLLSPGGGSHHTSTLKMAGQETQGLIQQDGLNETYEGVGTGTIIAKDENEAKKKKCCGSMPDEEENSSSTSATRAIEIWR